jgi:integrase-like protein
MAVGLRLRPTAILASQTTVSGPHQPVSLRRPRLDDFTWQALRHTFASRLVAAGVDLRTVQELGGWRTLSMVQRYTHLSPGHLAAAVEKIVAVPAVSAPGAVELGPNLGLVAKTV